MWPSIFSGKWYQMSQARNLIVSALSCTAFISLDLLDSILCISYSFLDGFFEGHSSPCYCHRRGNEELSETLYRRKNVFRELGFLGLGRECGNLGEKDGVVMGGSRWSDCRCESCLSWMNNNGDSGLHVRVLEPTQEFIKDNSGRSACENVVFLHGFLSSSSFWTETVFPNLSEPVKRNHRLLAVDLLGFGESPKPRNCFYTLKDHLETIEKSVLCSFQLDSFHLVAHSMGCVIALALAAKFPNSVKSITLVAPPFFPSKEGSLKVLEKLAERRLWPLLTFGSAVMSWYEHIGRSVCFVICRNHRMWEKILKLVIRKRDLHFMIMDLTRHTHHSAWHSMHNVICGASKHMESFLEVLTEARVKICVVQGDRDQVVPVECSENIKKVSPISQVDLIRDADHISVVLSREREITRYLENIWTSVASS